MPRRPDMPPLAAADLDPDPIEQFRTWFAEAESEAPLAEAIALATVDGEGLPDARMVLLKGFGPDGFRFFTNYGSAKARAARRRRRGGADRLLARARPSGPGPGNGRAARRRGLRRLLRHPSARLPARCLGLAAVATARIAGGARHAGSPRPTERFDGGAVPRPAHWGGYLLRPRSIEFWQGQVARLHDRFRYARDGDGWRIERLAP